MIPTNLTSAIIFDMDGLLINSEPFWREAEIKVFKTVNIHLTEEDCFKTMGWRTSEIISYYFNQFPWEHKSQKQVEDDMIDEVANLIQQKAQLMEGAYQAIETANKVANKVGLASSSPIRLINTVLSHFGLQNYFAEVSSAEFEPFGKPHPSVYLTTALKLGVEPYACIALEDSLNGVISAKAARMQTFAVPDKNDSNLPKFAVADVVLDSLSLFTPDLIRTLGIK